MALTVKNIIVGAGRLYIAEYGSGGPVALPSFNTTGGSIRGDFEAAADWREVGFTSEGAEIGYDPTYTDVMVDQYKDAARLFLESETFTLSTTLVEGTLANLIVAWGRSTDNLVTGDPLGDGSTATKFSLGVGPDCPEQYTVAIVGPAAGCPEGTNIERIYYAPRVVSVEGSTHTLSRTGETVFPVSFRVLPDDTRAEGEEYGEIVDRTRHTA